MGSDVCLPSEVRRLLVLIVLTSLIGCASPAARRDATFGPVGVRISPTFSRVADGRLEADVELRDAYGDSVKGGGVVTLRLFSYDPKAPLVQGREIGTAPIRPGDRRGTAAALAVGESDLSLRPSSRRRAG